MSGVGLFYFDPFYTAIIAVAVFCVGLCLGSFSSAIAYRAVREESWIVTGFGDNKSAARSKCPHCQHQLGFYDLIPVISWVLMAGKCRYCKASISIRYPVLELLAAFLLTGYYFYTGYSQNIILNGLFVVSIPFSLALIAAKFEKGRKLPFSLWFMGLLSMCGMVVLCIF